MENKIRNDYAGFYYNISRAACCDIGNSPTGENEAMRFITNAKSYYLKLQKGGVEDIAPIRECLNTFKKRLGMEVLEMRLSYNLKLEAVYSYSLDKNWDCAVERLDKFKTFAEQNIDCFGEIKIKDDYDEAIETLSDSLDKFTERFR